MNRSLEFSVAYGDKVTCTFTNTRKPSSIDVTKTPDPATVNEPGGNVKYTVGVTNTSEVDKVEADGGELRRQGERELPPTDPRRHDARHQLDRLHVQTPVTAGNGLPVG